MRALSALASTTLFVQLISTSMPVSAADELSGLWREVAPTFAAVEPLDLKAASGPFTTPFQPGAYREFALDVAALRRIVATVSSPAEGQERDALPRIQLKPSGA